MTEAISDTGPILHLSEIDTLFCLHIFERLYIPTLVAAELEYFGLHPDKLSISTTISVVPVDQRQRESLLQTTTHPPIHPADAEVFILGQDGNFPGLVLTDDMGLRQHLEQQGLLVVGSVGILVRAYHQGIMLYAPLKEAIDALFHESTLYLSPAFQIYVRELIDNLD
jgi:predicted nucleic acid-binding protein